MKTKLLRLLALLTMLAFALTTWGCIAPYHHHRGHRTGYYQPYHPRGRSYHTPPGHRKHHYRQHRHPSAVIYL